MIHEILVPHRDKFYKIKKLQIQNQIPSHRTLIIAVAAVVALLLLLAETVLLLLLVVVVVVVGPTSIS
jgi:phosphatidylserine synthase